MEAMALSGLAVSRIGGGPLTSENLADVALLSRHAAGIVLTLSAAHRVRTAPAAPAALQIVVPSDPRPGGKCRSSGRKFGGLFSIRTTEQGFWETGGKRLDRAFFSTFCSCGPEVSIRTSCWPCDHVRLVLGALSWN